MALSHKAGRGLVGMLLGGGMTLAFAAPASAYSAAPSTVADASALLCSGASCDGLDPEATGCAATGVTADTASTAFGTVDLRFSTACQTNWVRITNYPGGGQALFLDVQDDDRGVSILFDVPTPITAGTHFGNMVFSPGSNCARGFAIRNGVLIADLESSGC